MVYRQGERVAITQWQPSGVGTITGRVLLDGEPIENASVTILGVELFTDASGQFSDELIPEGTYEIEAAKTIDGIFYSIRQTVTIFAGVTTSVELVLQQPDNIFRQVTIKGKMFILDYENVGDNETGNFPFFESRHISPFNRTESIHIDNCVGNEVRVELDVDIRLESDNTTVAVTGEARLYEDDGIWPFGPDCNDGEHKETQTLSLTVLEDQSLPLEGGIRLENDGDRSDIDFIITNSQQ